MLFRINALIISWPGSESSVLDGYDFPGQGWARVLNPKLDAQAEAGYKCAKASQEQVPKANLGFDGHPNRVQYFASLRNYSNFQSSR